MLCDCHVHIVGPIEKYPQVPNRSYLAVPASLEQLRDSAAPRGVSRFAIVQPSFYGTDNTVLLESLDALGDRGRGVAVVDPATATGPLLADYEARGVRGLRLNLYSPMGADPAGLASAFAAAATLARPHDWHVEVIAPIAVLAAAAEVLAQVRERAPVPVVIDHYGLCGNNRPASAAGRALLELLRRPHVWMKLSAPYRVSDDPLNTRPDPEWRTALVAVAAERCVWGSDWPFTPPHDAHKGATIAVGHRALSYDKMVDDFVDGLGSEERYRAVMQDNPARLYGF